MTQKLYLTFDVDWAPEPVVAQVLRALEAATARATFFATHESAVLRAADPKMIEIGLHPNYGNAPQENPVLELKKLYPEARGARSHGLFVSSAILSGYAKAGLEYESNIFLFKHKGLHAVRRSASLISIPFIWSDDKHLELGLKFDFHELPLENDGLTVVNFHPIHIFLNTDVQATYARAKQDYQNVRWLEQVRNGGAGIGTLFTELLNHVRERRVETGLMRDIRLSA